MTNTTTSEILLTGLDGSNPLAFMAALGVLNALSDSAPPGSAIPLLSWRDEGVWRPVLHAAPDVGGIEGVIRILLADLESWKDDPVLQLKYSKETAKGVKEGRDLKPPAGVYRLYLESLPKGPSTRRALDFAAAFATETAFYKGRTAPTPFHFTSGQQQFLQMATILAGSISDQGLQEALVGPWRYESEQPEFHWDCEACRDYALLASDPSDEKPSVPGADWLAFRSLSFFRSAPLGHKIMTACWIREANDVAFVWPLWSQAISRATVYSLLGQVPSHLDNQGIHHPKSRERLGIVEVLRSTVRRYGKGGCYGSFSPPAVL